jgi:predicted nucleic acid-binding protein
MKAELWWAQGTKRPSSSYAEIWKKYLSPRKCGLGRPGLDIPRGAMGLPVPLPDLLIAQVAIAEKLELWHADEHFEEIKRAVPFETKAFMK